jgi:hypothetical protein
MVLVVVVLVGVYSRCPGLHMHRALYEYIAAAHKVSLSGTMLE